MYCTEPLAAADDACDSPLDDNAADGSIDRRALSHGFVSGAGGAPSAMDDYDDAPPAAPPLRHGFAAPAAASVSSAAAERGAITVDNSEWVEQWRRDRERR
eukprot:6543135-Prymnesium_polylepis.1